MDQIPKELQRRVLRRAMKSAAAPVVLRAKQNAGRSSTKDSGLLRDSIAFSITQKRSGKVIANIRPLGKTVVVQRTGKDGKKRQVKARAAWYAHHLEFGNKHMPPEPIFRPALEASLGEALAGYTAEIKSELGKLTRAAARKAKRAEKLNVGKS
jgi:HK97 gp10 family phage protein